MTAGAAAAAAPTPEQPAAGGATADQAAAAATAAPPAVVHDEDKWLINKPVERRSEALNEEYNDCFVRFWTWVSCGGPAARMRQLYINGRLSRCWDEYTRFKNCMIGKLNPDQVITVLPGPHPVWHIRSKKDAAAFWRQHYAHLGAAATSREEPQGGLRPDVTQPEGSS
ncbi:hypothetical protein OEZ85_013770 [Tetradesmus obliquus]|uniref:Uncharacterized protein n=1 Tax=Tetradesmus obliquus TaxID=3088 RepID=A0ABY8UAY7_TETOB|nr:hypothetical protein OEZ85_013770 [Tetradesmus obliquus]